MSRFAPTTATSNRNGLFRLTYEATLGTRERSAVHRTAPYLAGLDDQVARAQSMGSGTSRIVRVRAADAAF